MTERKTDKTGTPDRLGDRFPCLGAIGHEVKEAETRGEQDLVMLLLKHHNLLARALYAHCRRAA